MDRLVRENLSAPLMMKFERMSGAASFTAIEGVP
jgi:hypothetical protein